MYIIIVGGGRLGYYLAKALLDEGHEVLILEKDAAVCQSINNELGSICLRGDGCEAMTLEQAGTSRADMLIAVTGEDEDNLVACQVAKHKFKVLRTIARVRNPRNEDFFRQLGVDVAVSSTSIILEHIKHELPTHPLMHLLTIQEKELEIVEVTISPESITVGKQVRELSLPPESILSLVIRKERKPTVPTGTTTLQDGDQIIAVTRPESVEALKSALTGS
ncbi:MAG TPA: TrkA family potassium uptake protein [Dehalococcoidia bacterium]|nr:TrkA family potassium uptake protein [Dehalococcoidia bacterium]